MKRLSILLLLVTSVSAQQKFASPSQSADEQQIRRIAEEWKDTYNRNDAAAGAALYAEDGYYVSQHLTTGIIQGRDAIRANIQRGIDSGGHVDSIEVLRLEIKGDFAYEVGTYQATNAGQKVTGRNILVFKKINGTWLIVAHTSVVPEHP
ncbi:MAG TPA: DUF4440 domain-containing protein [Bacteroidota bacterium]|nr:DUF4440 domain-containing protein [Bacteroidota bacterium]